MVNKIYLREENIKIEDSIKILDYFYSLEEGFIKEGLKEITPFKDFAKLFGIIYGFFIKLVKKIFSSSFKNYFWYKGVLFRNKKLTKNDFFLKLFKNGDSKAFILVKKDSIENGNNIVIDKIISLEKGIGTIAIKEVCNYFKNNNIEVTPSVYGIGFWEKMKTKYEGDINIIINYT